MELWILDKDFVVQGVIDSFESLLWVTRYDDFGDFELYLQMDIKLLDMIKEDYYVWLAGYEDHMIVEDIQVKTNVTDGNNLIISGRSLESILTRRIVWEQTIIKGNLQDAIEKLLNDSIISPKDPKRKIPNFIFNKSKDERITSLTVDTQFTGDNLYDAIRDICITNDISFRMYLSEDYKFIFELYTGEDYSYNQIKNPYITFSQGYGNLLNSSYLTSTKPLKTVTLIGGEGEGSDRRTAELDKLELEGLYRREIFTDAREISSKTDNGTLPAEEYIKQLKEKGAAILEENKEDELFEGDVDYDSMFVYGKHYKIGDIVQLKTEYGIERPTRVVEFIRSKDLEGVKIYPTFKVEVK